MYLFISLWPLYATFILVSNHVCVCVVFVYCCVCVLSTCPSFSWWVFHLFFHHFTGLTLSLGTLQCLVFYYLKMLLSSNLVPLCHCALNIQHFFLPSRFAFELPNLCNTRILFVIRVEHMAEETPFPFLLASFPILLCTSPLHVPFVFWVRGSFSLSLPFAIASRVFASRSYFSSVSEPLVLQQSGSW